MAGEWKERYEYPKKFQRKRSGLKSTCDNITLTWKKNWGKKGPRTSKKYNTHVVTQNPYTLRQYYNSYKCCWSIILS